MTSENQPQADANPVVEVLDWVGDQGGLLAPVIGKHAARAISEFVGGAMQVPAKFFSAIAQSMQDDADAKSEIRKAVAGVVANSAAADPAIVRRMSQRWLSKEMAAQLNIEAVAKIAVEDLRNDPPVEDEAPSEDFLNRLSGYAEQASSEEMRILLARILAGELRKPGSFSLAALHVMSVMDKRLAEDIAQAACWTTNDYILRIGSFNTGPRLELCCRLEDVGILRSRNLSREFTVGAAVPLGLVLGPSPASRIVLTPSSLKEVQFRVPVFSLSSIGREIFSILDVTPSDEDVALIADTLLSINGITQVYRGGLHYFPDGEIGVANPILVAGKG